MKKNPGLKMILAVIAVSVLSIGTYAFADFNDLNMHLQNNMMDLEGRNFDYEDMMNYEDSNYDFGNMMNGSMMNGNMMNGNQPYISVDFNKDELKDIDELKENIEKYLENYSGEFIIEDIFVYSNSNYYFSITEEETGKGAMELLVNPITGDVYPEYGPNMMWNTKYGMHSNGSSFGMMSNIEFNSSDEVRFSDEDALEKANVYLSKIQNNLSAEIGGHAFYGYYTFHVNEDENLEGMISVNSYTGEVWYHNWHGNVMEVISEDH